MSFLTSEPASHSAKALVRIQNVWKKRGDNTVLRDVNLECREGEVLSLLGPSGAGKSTLLRCINALDLPDRGLIFLEDEPIGAKRQASRFIRMNEREIARQREQIGMVFQNFNLFPHRTVLQNITDAPMRIRGESRDSAIARAESLLARVDLSSKGDAYPSQLSGGQQQRIAIARALAMQPRLMLFDEPTSALDPHLTHEVLDVMKDLARSGMTMIIVTHEIAFARDIGGRTAVMADGRIIEEGNAAEILTNPSDPRVRAFLSRSLAA